MWLVVLARPLDAGQVLGYERRAYEWLIANIITCEDFSRDPYDKYLYWGERLYEIWREIDDPTLMAAIERWSE